MYSYSLGVKPVSLIKWPEQEGVHAIVGALQPVQVVCSDCDIDPSITWYGSDDTILDSNSSFEAGSTLTMVIDYNTKVFQQVYYK